MQKSDFINRAEPRELLHHSCPGSSVSLWTQHQWFLLGTDCLGAVCVLCDHKACEHSTTHPCWPRFYSASAEPVARIQPTSLKDRQPNSDHVTTQGLTHDQLHVASWLSSPTPSTTAAALSWPLVSRLQSNTFSIRPGGSLEYDILFPALPTHLLALSLC